MSTLEAFRQAQSHVHSYTLLSPGIEICSCGLMRAAHPDER